MTQFLISFLPTSIFRHKRGAQTNFGPFGPLFDDFDPQNSVYPLLKELSFENRILRQSP